MSYQRDRYLTVVKDHDGGGLVCPHDMTSLLYKRFRPRWAGTMQPDHACVGRRRARRGTTATRVDRLQLRAGVDGIRNSLVRTPAVRQPVRSGAPLPLPVPRMAGEIDDSRIDDADKHRLIRRVASALGWRAKGRTRTPMAD